MKPNDLVVVYVGFISGLGGKKRPVLILEEDNNLLYFYAITSKFENKSEKIKKQYFPITDWKKSGLVKESWIDIGQVLAVNLDEDIVAKKIGKLSISSAYQLSSFIKNFNEHQA